jgi:hypothetical protein
MLCGSIRITRDDFGAPVALFLFANADGHPEANGAGTEEVDVQAPERLSPVSKPLAAWPSHQAASGDRLQSRSAEFG